MFARLVNKIVLLQRTSILRIQILHDDTGKEITIGAKRNRLLQRAEGKYCCFVDDDDEITDDYFKVITDSRLNVDCIVLNGIMYLDGVKIKPFYHSIKYDNWWEDETAYYRYPNHWNPILTSIAKQIEYPDISFREDHEYSKRLQNSKLIKTEYKHDTIQYIYYYSTINKSYEWTKKPRQIRMVGGRFKLI
jgi:glycosyltransferase involved in cell wall biosynthesis